MASFEVEQGKNFSERLSVSSTPQVTVAGAGGLTASASSNGVTLSGRIDKPGRCKVTITETRVTEVTINVQPSQKILDKDPLDIIVKGVTGKWPTKG